MTARPSSPVGQGQYLLTRCSNEMLFAAVHESGIDTNPTARHVRCSAAIEGKEDIEQADAYGGAVAGVA